MMIDLIWLTNNQTQQPNWSLGAVFSSAPQVDAVAKLLTNLETAPDRFCLVWDARLGSPSETAVATLTQTPGDAWHAGLHLGLGEQPELINFVAPVWRFNRDPDHHIRATSWRLSLQACLLRTDLLNKLGGLHSDFETLAGAGLEFGHRLIRRGAFVIHDPALLSETTPITASPPSLADAFRFVWLGYGRQWAIYALWRAVVNGYGLRQTHTVFRRVKGIRPLPNTSTYFPSALPSKSPLPTVSVLIPTLDRYPYLFKLLAQMEQQTIPPFEIIVIDQTEPARRINDWPQQFTNLPLRVIWQAPPGQCTSRNAGLQIAQGDSILFLDDDDEIEPDLIATHLAYMQNHQIDASCGVAVEDGAGHLPHDFTYPRASDVFPTNNSLLKRQALVDSGLFDLAYEHGPRADGDLGMRLYLAGKQLGLNPNASVFHHHAPQGGLRIHKARKITRAGSRRSLRQRHLLSPTEGYLWCRYFRPHQVNEALLIRTLSTLQGQGSRVRQLLRFMLMLFHLPLTWLQNKRRLSQGQAALATHPTIPKLKRLDFHDSVT